jgi:hypothetical protein
LLRQAFDQILGLPGRALDQIAEDDDWESEGIGS